ncbi:tyrosine-protein phosphatase [Streptomyces albidoflavus]|uniref:tyrosine-protein phosphatase n=1 Tax=Streptomyces albidoflavus TaxID=1886 RepID=UPI00211C2CF9|nr:tyrosine-protein phosphatase [Streptomyces albidoflavus]
MTAAAPPAPHIRRHLTWDGCFNVRDLGGLGRHATGAVVRADPVETPTAAGRAAAHAPGVRTVRDLRHDAARGAGDARRRRARSFGTAGAGGVPQGAADLLLHLRPAADRLRREGAEGDRQGADGRRRDAGGVAGAGDGPAGVQREAAAGGAADRGGAARARLR